MPAIDSTQAVDLNSPIHTMHTWDETAWLLQYNSSIMLGFFFKWLFWGGYSSVFLSLRGWSEVSKKRTWMIKGYVGVYWFWLVIALHGNNGVRTPLNLSRRIFRWFLTWYIQIIKEPCFTDSFSVLYRRWSPREKKITETKYNNNTQTKQEKIYKTMQFNKQKQQTD